MNEQVDEIAFRAGCRRHKYWDPNHPDLEGFIINQESLDKFAGLIVQEHIKLIQHRWYELNNVESTKDENSRDVGIRVGKKSEDIYLIEAIKKHFGVE